MKKTESKKELPAKEQAALLQTLQKRFEQNMTRHPGLAWTKVQARLEKEPAELWSLHQMEKTDGEPDVIAHDKKTGELLFADCSPQSPAGRVSLCYDREALDSRKEHKPRSSVVEMAAEMGIDLLTEEQYLELQKLGEFDTKSSSWVQTPPAMRKQGGALYCDRRYGRVFPGHNGAQSYYNSRGFRGCLRV